MLNHNQAKIFLLVQNSHRIFCYFNFTPLIIKKFNDKHGEDAWGNSKPALKVYRKEGFHETEIKTVIIDMFTDNWYIDLENSAEDLFVKFGRVLYNDYFVPVLISNIVTTPRSYVDGDTSVYFIDVSKTHNKKGTKSQIQEAAIDSFNK